MLAATALLCFGGFVGCALYRMPGLEKNTLYDSLLERYFTAMFSGCATPWDVLLVVTKCVFREILPLGVIFFGGFTVFTGFISGGMLLYRGLLFGFRVLNARIHIENWIAGGRDMLSRRIFRCLDADGDRRGAGVRVLFPTEKAGNQEPRVRATTCSFS